MRSSSSEEVSTVRTLLVHSFFVSRRALRSGCAQGVQRRGPLFPCTLSHECFRGLAALCSVLNSQQILACAAEEPPIPDSIDEQEQSPRSLVGCSIVATVVFLKLICPHICKREAFEGCTYSDGSCAGCKLMTIEQLLRDACHHYGKTPFW